MSKTENFECFCGSCPNFEKCLERLRKLGVDEKELKLIQEAKLRNEPMGYALIALYYILKAAQVSVEKLEAQQKRSRKWPFW